ncbi:P-aminobenzoate N-oxygenase AurF family protein [Mycobacterium kansasii]|uniref:p-aminobenzoate N-oxygenase AurF family protein n=1 Tax=Mycobacterium kansasii TaxID=1768 RepID=A0A1V3XGL5_MYCKA|nr:P-aminobenzoate N-oxygenase AurF family protein [Mycobacterium kansasii]
MSLYGTPMWDEMTREQQIELSKQELVNTLSAGIWFENMLNQSLLRTILHEDPTSRSTHYKLTELGDETRHMVMFGKAIERIGAKPVRPGGCTGWSSTRFRWPSSGVRCCGWPR